MRMWGKILAGTAIALALAPSNVNAPIGTIDDVAEGVGFHETHSPSPPPQEVLIDEIVRDSFGENAGLYIQRLGGGISRSLYRLTEDIAWVIDPKSMRYLEIIAQEKDKPVKEYLISLNTTVIRPKQYNPDRPLWETTKIILPETIDSRLTSRLNKEIKRRVEGNMVVLLNTESLREELEISFARAGEYRDFIIESSKLSGLPVCLIYGIITNESEGNLRGDSPAYAAGPMMFMKSTAIESGLEVNRFKDERYHPKAIERGSEYMAKLIKKFGFIFGMASYNGGYGTIRDTLIKYNEAGIQAFMALNSESENFGIRVLSRALIYCHHKELGLEIKERPTFSEVIANSFLYRVKPKQTLSKIAKLHKTTERALLRLNSLSDPDDIRAGQLLYIPNSKHLNSVFYKI